ncbi:MAG: hypothetical protein FWF85_00615 [Clostridiales bacterium]|nr:hypothetical protein [Clostridiales bacterium]
MERILLYQAEKLQVISPIANNISIDGLIKSLEKIPEIDHVLPCDPVRIDINTIFENRPLAKAYLVSREDIKIILEYTSATLTRGRLPEKNHEIIVDQKYATNQNLKIGDSLGGQLEIIGILESDCYLVAGIADSPDLQSVVILSSGNNINYSKNLSDEKLKIEDPNNLVAEDYFSQKDIQQRYANIEYRIYFLIKTTAVVLIILCLMALLSLYIRDRQAELCFYYSIGFSKKDIYLSVLKKLLFVFGISILIGSALSIVLYFLVKCFIIIPLGLNISLFMAKELLHCFACLFLIFAAMQPAIFFAMQKVDTIDILEEEMI